MLDIFASKPQWLEHADLADTQQEIQNLRQSHLQKIQQALSENSQINQFLQSPLIANHLDFAHDVVQIGRGDEVSAEQKTALLPLLQAQMPWKKGPFSLFGIEIDAEWRSDFKWNRLRQHMSSLQGQVVADIGCHNGYFMFRMLADQPELVIGFEPVVKHWLSFQLLNSMARQASLQFELFGVEHIDLFPQYFDSIFCLGILYHHTDPIGLLRKMRQALKPGGTLWIDCQGIPGEESMALIPKNRYANARGIWFLPTQSALETWIRRAGFHKIDCIFGEALSPLEQRSTAWAPVKSLSDFLDPGDPSKTIEGYPAPWRFYLKVS
ncbi:MAG: tRNA 5-methoxyuridine(34)/uridine 5-oxyacetic acid(34) synthase CmoB [Oligoflexus sp.]